MYLQDVDTDFISNAFTNGLTEDHNVPYVSRNWLECGYTAKNVC